MAIRLLIAEDETVVRHALAQVLGAEEDIEVVAMAPNGEAAVVMAEDREPDVMLMDVSMPKLDGIEATRRVKAARPECAVVMLTVHHDDEYVFRAIKAGASAYVLKDALPEEIAEAVRAAARGEGYLQASLVHRVMGEFARISRQREAAKSIFAELTRRELEVLELLGQALRNRDIAERLYISEKTVKNHVSSIFAKLQVNDRTEAALLASQHGLADPAPPSPDLNE